jgi:hypothetical protein
MEMGHQVRSAALALVLVLVSGGASAWGQPAICPPPAEPDSMAACYSYVETLPYCQGVADRWLRVVVEDPPRPGQRARVTLAPGTTCGLEDMMLRRLGCRPKPVSRTYESLKVHAWPDPQGAAWFLVRELDYVVMAWPGAAIASVYNAGWTPERIMVRGIVPMVAWVSAVDIAATDTLVVPLRFHGLPTKPIQPGSGQ